jgi:hypothetical protein
MKFRFVNTNSKGWSSRAVAGVGYGVKVDVNNGILQDVVLCEAMQPRGAAGMDFIETASGPLPIQIVTPQDFINDLVTIANTKQGENGHQVRFGHPAQCEQTLGSYCGRVKNIRVRGNQAIGDIHLAKAAENAPSKGNLREYILQLAQEDSEAIMMSIVFTAGDQYFYNSEHQREIFIGDVDQISYLSSLPDVSRILFETVLDWHFTDFVDQGANTTDLFRNHRGEEVLSAKMFEFLDSNPDVMEILTNKPEIVNQFMRKYENYRDFKSKKAMSKTQTESRTLLQKAKAALETVFKSETQTEVVSKTIEAVTSEGVSITIESEMTVPMVGDLVFISGSTDVAPEGEHILTGDFEGWVITVDAGGVITSVVEPSSEAPEDAPVSEPAAPAAPAMASAESVLNEKNIQSLTEIVTRQTQIISELKGLIGSLSSDMEILKTAPLVSRAFASSPVVVSNLKGNDDSPLTEWEAKRRELMGRK